MPMLVNQMVVLFGDEEVKETNEKSKVIRKENKKVWCRKVKIDLTLDDIQ